MLASIPYRTFPEFHVGPVPIRTFGLCVGLGMLVGAWIFIRAARRRGIDPDLLTRLAWYVLLFGLIGSRITFVFTHLSDFADDPLAVFALWQGGLQFSGAFLIAIAVIWWFARRHPELRGLELSDDIVLGLVPGLMIGRIGCVSVGEHLGGPTTFFLGWKYLGGPTREPVVGGVGAVIHNTAIYEIVLLAPLALLLWWLHHRGVRAGWLTVTFLGWYGVQRFSTDFLRAYDETVFGLTGAQYICIAMVVGSAVLAWYLLRTTPGSEVLGPSAEPDPGLARTSDKSPDA